MGNWSWFVMELVIAVAVGVLLLPLRRRKKFPDQARYDPAVLSVTDSAGNTYTQKWSGWQDEDTWEEHWVRLCGAPVITVAVKLTKRPPRGRPGTRI